MNDTSRTIMTKDALYEQLRVINNMKRGRPRIPRGALNIEQKYKLLTKLAELYEKLQPALADSGLDDQQIMVLAKNELKRFVDRDPMFRPNFMTPQTSNRLDVFED